jgi:hypothetical protein
MSKLSSLVVRPPCKCSESLHIRHIQPQHSPFKKSTGWRDMQAGILLCINVLILLWMMEGWWVTFLALTVQLHTPTTRKHLWTQLGRDCTIWFWQRRLDKNKWAGSWGGKCIDKVIHVLASLNWGPPSFYFVMGGWTWFSCMKEFTYLFEVDVLLFLRYVVSMGGGLLVTTLGASLPADCIQGG